MATQLVHVCKHLRTKSLFTPEGRGKVLVEPSPTATYWCNRSGTAIGPDNDFVGPKECHAGRTCYLPTPLVLSEKEDT